ncbi:uncharacterized protein LOC112084058 [Eutrema salsugineum]|uniref:uncharacterized protein LOC112084058 n=1 Tax=Eutrema salsugineum TaxID=72664 RepID=UPI000CED7E0A|nr:uncharacterized protein LOC112084058 [Eutrema salsugineum]
MEDTGKTNFLLLDKTAEPIVTQSAAQLLNGSFDEIEDPEAIPQALKDLVGKTYMFAICIEKENVLYGSEIYKYSKAGNGQDLIKIEYESEQDNLLNNVVSIVSGDEVSLIGTISDGISGSLSSHSGSFCTPSSKRSSEDSNNLPDLSSTSKKQCTKIIKVENITDEEEVKPQIAVKEEDKK